MVVPLLFAYKVAGASLHPANMLCCMPGSLYLAGRELTELALCDRRQGC